MSYSFELDFIKREKGDLLGPFHVRIYVQTDTGGEDGLMFITPDCVSVKELEYHIDRLQKELEDIRKRAR